MFENMNIKKIALWLFVTMVISFMIAGSILATNGAGKTLYSHSGTVTPRNIDIEKTFGLSGIKSIDIDTVSSDIHIIPVDTNEIKVHFYGVGRTNGDSTDPELYSEVNGSRLDVHVKYKIRVNIGFNFQIEHTKLDIYVPKSYSESIKANAVSGNLEMNGLSLDRMQFSSTSGNFTASSVGTKQTNFNSTSGKMNARSFSGNLDFNSVSGGLDVEYSSFNHNISAHTTSGGSKIKLPANSEFNVHFTSVSGKLRNSFPLTTTGLMEKRKIEGSVGRSSNQISIGSVSGDATISN